MGNVHQIADIHDTARLQEQWLRENAAAVAAVRPGWADTERTWADGYQGVVSLLVFERAIGTVGIEQSFSVDGDVIAALDPPVVRIEIETLDTNAVNHDDASQVGMDLVRAAQTINGPGDMSVTMIEIVANALDVRPGDIYALGEKR